MRIAPSGWMSLGDLLLLCVIAGLCGALGQAAAGTGRGGCLASVALGFIGALIGSWLARELDWPTLLSVEVGGTDFPLVWSVVGSALFVALITLVTRPRAPRRE